MLPSVRPTTSAPETFKLSRLNGWPMRSPTDASTQPSRIASHGSGPMRFATPSSWRTFTTYSLPVSPAHRSARIAHARIAAENRGVLRDRQLARIDPRMTGVVRKWFASPRAPAAVSTQLDDLALRRILSSASAALARTFLSGSWRAVTRSGAVGAAAGPILPSASAALARTFLSRS